MGLGLMVALTIPGGGLAQETALPKSDLGTTTQGDAMEVGDSSKAGPQNEPEQSLAPQRQGSAPVEEISEAAGSAAQAMGALKQGEHLHYAIKYFGISGGTASVLTTQGPKTQPGSLVFRADLKTSSAISYVWRIEDTYLSMVDPTAGRTLATRLWVNENGKTSYREERYHRSKVSVDERWDDGRRKFRVKTAARPVDGLAAVWLMRERPLRPGDVERYSLFVSRRIYDVVAKVGEIEEINVDGRTQPAIRVQPTIYRKGVPVEGASLTIWYSADETRRPLRIRSKQRYGQVDFEIFTPGG
jgi:hypothetical protein